MLMFEYAVYYLVSGCILDAFVE